MTCHTCNAKGHIAPNCPQKVNYISDIDKDSPLSSSCVVSGTVAGKRVKKFLVDSDADISVVTQDLVPEKTTTVGQTMVTGATGEPVDCQLVELPVSVRGRHFKLEAAVLPRGSLSYPVLLGKNTPGLHIQWSIGPEPH